MNQRWRWRHWRWLLALLLLFSASWGCTRRKPQEGPLVLGYAPNITHAQAIVGAREGAFTQALQGRPLRTRVFNAGPQAMEAVLAGELDVAYVGPGPAIVAHVRSGGRVKVIAGAASGGAGLVADGVSSAAELRGLRVAVPQIGNTQDVALRVWLREQGLAVGNRPGQVQVTPLPNPEIVNLFRRDLLKAAWVPEPWAAILISDGASLLVDERALWPGGRFPTTVLVATDQALRHRRDGVKAVLRAHLALTRRAREDPLAFARQANDAFQSMTGKQLEEAVVKDAFSRLELVVDPMERQLRVVAEHAAALGYVPDASLSGLVDASLLRELGAKLPVEGVGGSGQPPGE